MRRPAPEWLLLPVFLLPLLGAAGFAILARDRHRASLEPWRTDVVGMIAERLKSGEFPGRWARVAGETLPCGTPVRLPGAEITLLDSGEAHGAGEPWILADAYPAGLGAAALADPAVRLRIEQGASPVDVGAVDEATSDLLRLAAGPDLPGLRGAPLPAATKLFLVRRWIRSVATDASLGDAEHVLETLVELQREVAARGLPAVPGEHRYGDLRLVSGIGNRGIVAYRTGWENRSSTLDLRGEEGDPVVVSLTVPGDARETGAAAEPLWTGWINAPLAGRWTVATRWGEAWWRSPFVSRWAGPVVGGTLLFLVFPTALFLAIRRRRKLDEARARFVTEIAHDLRTPITSLRLYSEMLASGRAPEESRGRYIEVLSRESTRVSGLLANLLDLSRLERGVREVEMEDFDLEEAVEPVVRDFALQYPDRADDLRITGDDDLRVRADRTALARCLENLLGNAGKFTPAGAEIRLSFEATGGRVRILVADKGPGIPARERRFLFKRFARGERARRDGIPGSGLGLSLVAELAAAMGGEARLVPREAGAAFEIVLREATNGG